MSHLHNGARQRLATEAHRAVVNGPSWYFIGVLIDCSSAGPLHSSAAYLILSSGTSQPPHQMVIPFKRCSPLFWSEPMDGLPFELPIFLVATFAGALVAGLSGFAFGLVDASIWLY